MEHFIIALRIPLLAFKRSKFGESDNDFVSGLYI